MPNVSVSQCEFPKVWDALNTLEAYNNGPKIKKPVMFHDSWDLLLRVAEDQLAGVTFVGEEELTFFDGEEEEQKALSKSKNLEAASEILRAYFMHEHAQPREIAAAQPAI